MTLASKGQIPAAERITQCHRRSTRQPKTASTQPSPSPSTRCVPIELVDATTVRPHSLPRPRPRPRPRSASSRHLFSLLCKTSLHLCLPSRVRSIVEADKLLFEARGCFRTSEAETPRRALPDARRRESYGAVASESGRLRLGVEIREER